MMMIGASGTISKNSTNIIKSGPGTPLINVSNMNKYQNMKDNAIKERPEEQSRK